MPILVSYNIMENLDKIKTILLSPFEIELFESSLVNLADTSNKLRYHNFAYSIRELSRHFLYSLSPEKNVKNCSWYKTETTDDKPTRFQRIKYAIQGGISDEILTEWGFEVEELNDTISSIKKIIDSLSKYTHINPETFNLNSTEIETKSDEVLYTFKKFVETIDNYKEDMKSFLDGTIEEHMISAVLSNSFESIDVLAPHYSLDYSEISNYSISEINDVEIVVDVEGDVYVTLEYGSRKERSEGDGLDLNESFPFSTKVRYFISEEFPSDDYEVDDFGVDTSEWYGDDEYRC